MSVYADLGLEPVINAAGTSTRVGGPLMHPAVAAAMAEAARACVPLDRLEGASSIIAEVTGAQAGYVNEGGLHQGVLVLHALDLDDRSVAPLLARLRAVLTS